MTAPTSAAAWRLDAAFQRTPAAATFFFFFFHRIRPPFFVIPVFPRTRQSLYTRRHAHTSPTCSRFAPHGEEGKLSGTGVLFRWGDGGMLSVGGLIRLGRTGTWMDGCYLYHARLAHSLGFCSLARSCTWTHTIVHIRSDQSIAFASTPSARVVARDYPSATHLPLFRHTPDFLSHSARQCLCTAITFSLFAQDNFSQLFTMFPSILPAREEKCRDCDAIQTWSSGPKR